MARKKRVNQQTKHNVQNAFSLIAGGQLERAKSIFEAQLGSQKTPDPRTLLGLASTLYFSGDIESAIDTLHLLLAQITADGVELLQTGLFYAMSGRRKPAGIALRRARATASDHSEILTNIAGGFSMMGDYREAANTAEMAIKADDGNEMAYRILGLAFFGMEDYPAAIDSLKKVTDLNPQDYMAHVYIGRCFACIEEWEESLSAFQKASFLDKKHPAINVGRAISLVQLGRVKDAVKAANSALKHISESPEDAYSLGTLYLDYLDNPDKAIAALVIAILHDPQNYDCMNDLIEAVIRSDAPNSIQHVLDALDKVDPDLGKTFLWALQRFASPEDDTSPRENPFQGIAPATPDGPVYQLRIDLEGARPPIWRRVLVPSHFTLAHLHDIIQAVMDWEDYHMHEFNVSDVAIGRMVYSDDAWGNQSLVDEFDVTIAQAHAASNGKFWYVYDFGDNWVHRIAVEKILPRDEKMRYPICTGGRQAAPLEDSGGIHGYYAHLEALADPDSEMHGESVEWLGEDFEPKAFDIDTINKRLERISSSPACE